MYGLRTDCHVCLSGGCNTWMPDTLDQSQYLQVDLLEIHRIRALDLQGAGCACDCYTKTFKVLYSDGIVWKFYEPARIQQGNSDPYGIVSLLFQPPITVSLRFVNLFYTQAREPK